MPKAPKTEDHIREAAYHLWKSEGEPHGRDQDFWLKAEAEIAPAPKKAARKPAAKKTAAPARKTAAKKPAAKKTPAKAKPGPA